MFTAKGPRKRKGFYLRQEDKPYERRSALTPTTVETLVRAGFEIHIERNPPQSEAGCYPGRIFANDEFESLRDRLVKENDKYKDKIETGWGPTNWMSTDLKGIAVLALEKVNHPKALLSFRRNMYIHAAHCFKNEKDWKKTLELIGRQGALLFDLEFLTDDANNRVATFDYYDGYAGAAAALLAYYRENHSALLELSSYPDAVALKKAIAERVTTVGKNYLPTRTVTMIDGLNKKGIVSISCEEIPPSAHCKTGKKLTDLKAIVVGASGRCGSGAVALLTEVGVSPENITKWDKEEIQKGGPYEEILCNDIFINCIYPKKHKVHMNNVFLTDKLINKHGCDDRRLKVITDVSPTSENNPINLKKYNCVTNLSDAVLRIEYEGQPDLSIIAIDGISNLLPREASEAYSKDLVEKALLNFPDRETNPVWKRAEELYCKKLVEAQSSWNEGVKVKDNWRERSEYE